MLPQRRIWETSFSLTGCLCRTGQTAWSLCTSWTLQLYWCEEKKKKHSHIDKKMQSWWNICSQTDGWSENLLVNGRHCYFTVTVEFNSHVSPAHVLVPCHHLQPVARHWEIRLTFLYKYFQLKYELIFNFSLINSSFRTSGCQFNGCPSFYFMLLKKAQLS